MRRVPYLIIEHDNNGNKIISYSCPNCRIKIPRDFYRDYDYCPVCYSSINRTAKSILKVYREVDSEFYKYFIDMFRKEKGIEYVNKSTNK